MVAKPRSNSSEEANRRGILSFNPDGHPVLEFGDHEAPLGLQ
jgi:hypothetical protein